MAKKRTMLNPSEQKPVDIDAMVASGASSFVIDSPFRKGVKIKLRLKEFTGEDILEKTEVLESNLRNQKWLTEKSLAPLIKSIKVTGQISPAVGRLNGDKVTVVYGSRRRMGVYFAGGTYKVLVSDDITDEEAKYISDAENISSKISLIERGAIWKNYKDEGLSYRSIAQDVEGGDVSHTIIKAGCDGYSLPDSIIMLYPSINCLGRPTINKLCAALKLKGDKEIAEHIKNKHSELINDLQSKYENNGDLDCSRLTKKIEKFCNPPVVPKSLSWPQEVIIKKNEAGNVSSIVFENELTAAQAESLKKYITNLLN